MRRAYPQFMASGGERLPREVLTHIFPLAYWDLIRKYNKQDVVLTEKLYDRLRAWIPNHPHLSMFTGDEWGCPVCGNKDLSKFRAGTSYANVQKYRMYQCPCGHWVRGTKKLQDATQTRSAR